MNQEETNKKSQPNIDINLLFNEIEKFFVRFMMKSTVDKWINEQKKRISALQIKN